MHRAFLLAGILTAALASAGPAPAASLKADYLITLEGLTIGHAGLEGSFDEARYDLKVRGELTGIVGAFSGGARGAASSRGSVAATRLVPGGFSASAESSSVARTVQVGLQGGAVTKVEIEPPFDYLPTRVPLTESHTRGVIDPLSGLVSVAETRAGALEPGACNRLVPVFDGSQRYNIVATFADSRIVRRPGYTGKVLVCAIRYVPIAGHRTDRDSVRFMAENRDISVWLAPVDGTRVLVPIRISVKTTVGTSVIEAQSWKVQ